MLPPTPFRFFFLEQTGLLQTPAGVPATPSTVSNLGLLDSANKHNHETIVKAIEANAKAIEANNQAMKDNKESS